MQINNHFKAYLLNKYQTQKAQQLTFKGQNDDWSSWDSWDTFESQQQAPQKKKFVLNPIKEAKRRAQEILDSAQREAEKIIANAKDTEKFITDNANQRAWVQAEERAQKRYDEIARKLEREHRGKKEEYAQQEAMLSANLRTIEGETQRLGEVLQRLNDGFIADEIKDRKARILEDLEGWELDYAYETPKDEFKIKYAYKKPENPIDLTKFTPKIPEKKPEISLELPEFKDGDNWSFEIPTLGAITYPQYTPKPFQEVHNHETSVAMDYADSVNWNCEKVARDLMQNFFDGHGQTLDGVKLSFEALEDGKYKVKIEGKAQFSQEKAILWGKSTKRDNAKAAGNFGEGLKVVVVKLLKEYGAQEVNIASDNWLVRYKPQQSAFCEDDALTFSLLNNEKVDGNYIEFETDNYALLNSLRRSVNNFYHSSNPDFQNLTFENEILGIKKLDDPNAKGSIYIAGQKFEYYDFFFNCYGWNDIPGWSIIFKEKPNSIDSFDISRDRVMLKQDELKKMLHEFIKSEKTTQKDIMQLMTLFNSYWKEDQNLNGYQDAFMNKIFDGILDGINSKRLSFIFPKRYLALDNGVHSEMAKHLYKDSHVICKSKFKQMGMKTICQKFSEDDTFDLIQPNKKQTKQIGLIKKVVKALEPYTSMVGEGKTQFNSNPNIYLFKPNSTIGGEHRKDGFWLSTDELSQSFNGLIATVLHEIAHVRGGDGTAAFTYALTDMLTAIMNATIGNQDTLVELRALKAAWDEITFNEND